MFIDPPLHIRPLAQPVFLDQPNAKASVLLIHGFADSPYSMHSLGAFLHDAGFRVLIMRLPGHGSRIEDLTKTGLADWQEAVRQDLHKLHAYPEPVAILGRSFGGVLALLACAEDPNAAQAMITLAAPRITEKQRFIRFLLPIIGLVRKTVPKPWVKPEERVLRIEVGRYVAFPIPTLREFFRALLLLTPQLLQSVQTPTLILHGADDAIADPRAAREFSTLLGAKQKQLLLIPGVGHSPESLNIHPSVQAAIKTFLDLQLTQHHAA